MKKIIVFIMAMLMLAAADAMAGEIINIVCTDFPCYDIARQVAGPHAEVSMLIKPGVEVHSFEPSPVDILSIGEADLFVYIGGESDAWADNILSSFGSDAPATLRMMDAVKCVETEGHEHDHGHEHDGPEYDEHIWLDPANAVKMTEAMGEKLEEIYRDAMHPFLNNAADYCAEIRAVDAEIRSIVENSSRNKIVFADRFPFLYFTEAYGLEYRAAFESCTAETEPSPMTLMMLIEEVASENIPVVYTIEMSSGNVARTIKEETGCGVEMLHSVQTVTQDEFAAGETYVSIMKKNAEALRKGLN